MVKAPPRPAEDPIEVITVGVRSPSGSNIPAPARVREAMEAAASSAAVELLAAYHVTVQPAGGAQSQGSGPAFAALGVVRFSSPGLNGTATLGASSSILKRSHPGGTPVSDWMAELANQFFGRFKLKLLRAGFELWSMAPAGVTGRLLATGVSQPQSVPLAFTDGAGGAVALWIEVELHREIKINAPAGDADIPREGDVIIFD
jgi:hypothetical protein